MASSLGLVITRCAGIDNFYIYLLSDIRLGGEGGNSLITLGTGSLIKTELLTMMNPGSEVNYKQIVAFRTLRPSQMFNLSTDQGTPASVNHLNKYLKLFNVDDLEYIVLRNDDVIENANIKHWDTICGVLNFFGCKFLLEIFRLSFHCRV